jgi:hypothetical protein
MRTPILAAVLLLTACGDAASPGFSTGPAITSVSASTTGSSTGADTTSTGPADDPAGSSASTSTSTGPALDSSTGPELPPDFGLPGPAGCQGKIDFLFVISNSGTMKGHQWQVLASLPEFITRIQAEFAEFDTHIMVTDTDAYWAMDDCSVCGPGCDPGGNRSSAAQSSTHATQQSEQASRSHRGATRAPVAASWRPAATSRATTPTPSRRSSASPRSAARAAAPRVQPTRWSRR